jgi:uncharacterized protein YbjT (DUF2867 family)
MEKVKETVLNAGYALQRFDPRSGRILVIDGNGVIGYRVAARLLSAGYPTVRVGCADNELADVAPLVSKGAEVKEFVWSKDYTYAQALQDVKSVYVAFPADFNMEERYPKFIAACKKAGVKHIVQLSFIHAVQEGTTAMRNFATMKETDDPFYKIPMVRTHGWCDERLVKSNIDYTILFASHLMSNPLRYQSNEIRKENKFYGASGGKGVNYVSPNDVAEAAVKALVEPKYHTSYNLTGAKVIKDEEVAKLLSVHENRTIEFVDHLPTDGVDPSFMALEHVKASGVEEKIAFVSKDFVKLCGHEQECYKTYLENKEAMSPKELVAFLPA